MTSKIKLTPILKVGPQETLVLVTSLDRDEKILPILKAHIEKYERLYESEPLFQLAGGYVFTQNDKEIFTPTCCSNLSTLTPWTAAVKHHSKEWGFLYIDHPWISVRWTGITLEFSDYHEKVDAEPKTELIPIAA